MEGRKEGCEGREEGRTWKEGNERKEMEGRKWKEGNGRKETEGRK